MQIRFAKRVGESHLKLSFGDGLGRRIDAIAFGAYDSPLGPRSRTMAARVSIWPGGWKSTLARAAVRTAAPRRRRTSLTEKFLPGREIIHLRRQHVCLKPLTQVARSSIG